MDVRASRALLSHRSDISPWLLISTVAINVACGARTLDEGDGGRLRYQPVDTSTTEDPSIPPASTRPVSVNPSALNPGAVNPNAVNPGAVNPGAVNPRPPNSDPDRPDPVQPPPLPVPDTPTAPVVGSDSPISPVPQPTTPVPTIDDSTTGFDTGWATCRQPLTLHVNPELASTHSGSLADAIDEQDFCGHGPEVVFTWTAQATGRYAFDTLGTDFDATLAVLEDESNDCGRQLHCDDDGATDRESLQAYLELYAEAGSTYRIAVEAYELQAEGHFTLNVRYLSGSEFDCEARGLASEPNVSISGDFTADAVSTSLPQTCNLGGRAVMFRYVAPFDAVYTFDTHGSTFDTVLAIGQGCAIAPWSCNDDSLAGQTSSVQQRLNSGQTALIQLGTYTPPAEGGDIEPLGADAAPGDAPIDADAGVSLNYTLNVSATPVAE